MSPEILITCVIPASPKDADSQNLKDLIASIKAQDFPQDKIEILVITEGDSESSKGIGIKRAKGLICGMFCADNMITNIQLFRNVYMDITRGFSAVYPVRYAYRKNDNSLNRYFSLIGGNDPVCYYLGKNDRKPHVESLTRTSDYPQSFGCNGFFYRADLIKATDLDHYYPMDNAMEVEGTPSALDCDWVWHRTAENLFTFLTKRYRYARDLYSDRQDRRWRMLDTRQDYWRLAGFILSTCLLIPCLITSIRGFRKIKDPAWFWHYPASLGILLTYGVLACRNLLKYRSLSRLFSVQSPLKHA